MTGSADELRDAFDGRPTPPAGLLARLSYYGRRNGYAYALASYIGRRSQRFWDLYAPMFTRGRIDAWLARPGTKIVNLGGGSNVFDRWLTADIDPRADVYMNILRPLPFDSATLDVIYLEEVIEHVELREARALLAECLRALKPGGAVRLTTPSLDAFVASFGASHAASQAINDIFYEHGHRHIHSRESIRGLLAQTGFVDARESSFRDPASEFGYFDTHCLRFAAISRPEMAQYWEARKPLAEAKP